MKLDDKGRILIPASIRRALRIRNAVKVMVRGNELVIKPLEDPVEALTRAVVEGSIDVEKEVGGFRRSAEKEAFRRLEERWS